MCVWQADGGSDQMRDLARLSVAIVRRSSVCRPGRAHSARSPLPLLAGRSKNPLSQDRKGQKTVNGFVKLRRGIAEHVSDGRLSTDCFAAFVMITIAANHQNGVWIGSGASLAEDMRWKKRKGQRVLMDLESSGYLRFVDNPKKPGSKAVEILKYLSSDSVNSDTNSDTTATNGASVGRVTATRQRQMGHLLASNRASVNSANNSESVSYSAEEFKNQEVREESRNKKEPRAHKARPAPPVCAKREGKPKTNPEPAPITSPQELQKELAKVASSKDLNQLQKPKPFRKLTPQQIRYAEVGRLIDGALLIVTEARNHGRPVYSPDVKEQLKEWAAENNVEYNGDRIAQALAIAEEKIAELKNGKEQHQHGTTKASAVTRAGRS